MASGFSVLAPRHRSSESEGRATGARRGLALSLVVFVGFSFSACAPRVPSQHERGLISRPALLVYLSLDAGPRAPDGADEDHQRLVASVAPRARAHELAGRLRVAVRERLPARPPWTKLAPAAEVSSTLGWLLVQEIPERPPELSRLEGLGVDAAVSLVIRRYGLQRSGGVLRVFLEVDGSLALLGEAKRTVWRERLRVDDAQLGLPPLGSQELLERPSLFARRLERLTAHVAERVVERLAPDATRGRGGAAGNHQGRQQRGDR